MPCVSPQWPCDSGRMHGGRPAGVVNIGISQRAPRRWSRRPPAGAVRSGRGRKRLRMPIMGIEVSETMELVLVILIVFVTLTALYFIQRWIGE